MSILDIQFLCYRGMPSLVPAQKNYLDLDFRLEHLVVLNVPHL
jgi:hypothetical protein